MISSHNIILFGDFNSRTSSVDDYVVCDSFICDIQGNVERFMENQDILNCFDKYEPPRDKTNNVSYPLNAQRRL